MQLHCSLEAAKGRSWVSLICRIRPAIHRAQQSGQQQQHQQRNRRRRAAVRAAHALPLQQATPRGALPACHPQRLAQPMAAGIGNLCTPAAAAGQRPKALNSRQPTASVPRTPPMVAGTVGRPGVDASVVSPVKAASAPSTATAQSARKKGG